MGVEIMLTEILSVFSRGILSIRFVLGAVQERRQGAGMTLRRSVKRLSWLDKSENQSIFPAL